MRRIDDLTVEELAVLTYEEAELFIDIEIAIAGIIPVSQPPYVAVEKIGIEPTIFAYEFSGILFLEESDAVAVSKMKRVISNCDYNLDPNYKWTEPERDFYGIKTVSFYSKEQIEAIRDKLKSSQKIKIKYENDLKEYNNYIKESQSHRDHVFDKMRNAREDMAFLNKAKEVYKKHISLAGGDMEIANKFFRDAYKDYPDVIVNIIGE